MILDKDLFDNLEQGALQSDIESVAARCVEIKRNLVVQDERDFGVRKLLNFGHTFAHGIEKASGYTVLHGHAVAAGMMLACRLAEATGFSQETCSTRLGPLLRRCGLPVGTRFSAAVLAREVAFDKKRSGQHISLILPKAVGDCRIEEVSMEEVPSLFEQAVRG